MAVKNRTWQIVEIAKDGDTTSRIFDVVIIVLILLNVLAVIAGSVDTIDKQYGTLLEYFEAFSVTIFTVEYLLRLWSCTSDHRYRHPFVGRIRFAIRPLLVIDLLSILPFFLQFAGLDLRFLRVLRVFRAIRIIKIGRYYPSLRLLGQVVLEKKEDLVIVTLVMAVLTVVSGCLVYAAENGAQPEVFPNIPVTLWWSLNVLAKVSIAGMYPVTHLGRMLGSIIGILGILMFALPTAIIGAGFIERINDGKKSRPDLSRCPHCGKPIAEGAVTTRKK